MSDGFTIWFTGLSGAGKTTIAGLVGPELERHGYTVEYLDGDVVRTHLSKGLGFSKADRDTNIERIGWVASRLTRHGGAVLVSAISPYEEPVDPELRIDTELHEPGESARIVLGKLAELGLVSEEIAA